MKVCNVVIDDQAFAEAESKMKLYGSVGFTHGMVATWFKEMGYTNTYVAYQVAHRLLRRLSKEGKIIHEKRRWRMA